MSINCSKFNDLIGEINYQNNDSENYKMPNLSKAANFYNCLEDVAESRNKADVVVNDSLISAALALTPMVLVNGAKLAVTVAKVANTASKIAKIEAVVDTAATATNLGFGGFQTKEVFDKCQEAQRDFDSLGTHQKIMSCEGVENILVNKSNTTNCASQALLTAATFAPSIVPSAFKLAKIFNKENGIWGAMAAKVRSGKSLSTAEASLMLTTLKETSTVEKLLVKGISSDDAQFAKVTLGRLYNQDKLSPAELIRLSKLIKPSNPPLLAITQQNNVEAILNSGRIQGRTEGSVYASTKPIETTLDTIKTGHMGNGEGTFIFTPEAAVLFKPHEVEGLYSGLKRIAGQYKGPFGDIIIEAYEKKIVDGKIYIIITKARKADTSIGEVLHAHNGTAVAVLRRAGREIGIETTSAVAAGAVGVKVVGEINGEDYIDEAALKLQSKEP